MTDSHSECVEIENRLNRELAQAYKKLQDQGLIIDELRELLHLERKFSPQIPTKGTGRKGETI